MAAILSRPECVNQETDELPTSRGLRYLVVFEAEWRIYASANYAIIGSDNGLSPLRRQAIIWTSAGLPMIRLLGTNFSAVLIEIQTFSLKKMRLKMPSAQCCPFCLGLDVFLTRFVSQVIWDIWNILVTVESVRSLLMPWHHSWWRQMESFSALLVFCAGNSPVTGEFTAKRPVTRSFNVFFNLRLNKQMSKQSRGWWFETQSRSLWRHCNVVQRHVQPSLCRRPGWHIPVYPAPLTCIALVW